ncbi:MAG: hypothetical protein AB1485_00505 [Candidatus Thermoplasmatota archaeon]
MSNKKEKEKLFTLVDIDRLCRGETLFFNCPHCSQKTVMEFKALEGDPDRIEVYWGKSLKEIKDKRKKLEEEIEELSL